MGQGIGEPGDRTRRIAAALAFSLSDSDICYLLRQDDKARRALAVTVAKRYLLEVQAALKEITEDPRYSKEERDKAQEHLSGYSSRTDGTLRQCFEPARGSSTTPGPLPNSNGDASRGR